ncbi:MAG: transglutaminase family protein [Eggerthellaceae bacterium]|nr:transglutaminase family protein [Eggerthellaceae bacterium]
MRILTYVFETALSFSEPVTDHSFVLRCLPKSTNTQTVMDSQIFTFPRVTLDEQVDGFGNRIMVGYLPEGHDSFNFYTTGQVMVAGDMAGTTPCHPMFLQPTRLTQWTEEMANFAREVIASGVVILSAARSAESKDLPGCDVGYPSTTALRASAQDDNGLGVLPQARGLCRAVHERFAYVPGVTSTSTTAAEAFGCETGVCQDYSHVMISLCRSAGIPARYVTGLMAGHGATHAWVEVHDGQRWHGLDPTNNNLVDDRYMLFATGRDFEDCPIECGIFRGAAEQTQEVSASLGDATSQNDPEQFLTF